MAHLTISFTIKGERKETTFTLVKEDIVFSLKGYSEAGELKTFPLEQDNETKIFTLKNDGVFEEDENIKENRLTEILNLKYKIKMLLFVLYDVCHTSHYFYRD